ncbi:MAG: MG2 domain-containing protein, partial [Bacteroidales bacterium]|nr:MG2 domain-containing protein [Bacteroidales bacterium]
MKKITLALFTAIVVTAATALTMKAFFNSKPSGEDKDGHVLTELWSEYAKAEAADLPLRQIEILSRIKTEALSRKLAWDFYDAGRKYVSVSVSRNWKLRDSLETRFREEILESSVPTARFAYMMDDARPDEVLAFLRDNAGVMKSSRNHGFYGMSFRYGGDRLAAREYRRSHYLNDWQFAMWTLLNTCGKCNVRDSEIYAELSEYEKDNYPFGILLEYCAIPYGYGCDREKSRKELKAFAGKYDGKAVSAWAKADLLEMEFSDLNDNDADAESYRELYGKCRELLKEIKAYSGDEAELVSELSSPANLADRLSSRNIDIDVKDGRAVIVLQNLDKVKLSILESGKSLSDTALVNERRSFYVGDTLEYSLPALDDGTYEIRASSGNVKAVRDFQIYRVSLALRREESGLCAYAADWKTGEPVGKADVRLYKNGNLLAEVKDFIFNGFTTLPEEIGAKISARSSYEMECSYTDYDGLKKSSRRISWSNWRFDKPESFREELDGEIFTDRRAYNPGDKAEFKAIFFRTDYQNSASVVPEGKSVEVSMFDSEHNLVEKKTLITNEFGSVAGSFDIPSGVRNGMFSIEAELGNGSVSGTFRVDEFVLPAFDLEFDETDRIYLPGDNLVFSGKLVSYSGHSLSGASVSYSIGSWGSVKEEGTMEIGTDGSFRKEFRTSADDSWRSYTLNLIVNDNTGETREWSRTLQVAGDFDLEVSLENGLLTEGKIIGSERFTKFRVLDREMAEVLFSIRSGYEMKTPVDVAYRIENEAGKPVCSGNAATGKPISLDFSALPSGLYRIIGEASMTSAAGKTYSDAGEISLLLVRPGDKMIDAPVAEVVAAGGAEVETGDKMDVLFGNADGDGLWAFADIFGENGRRL